MFYPTPSHDPVHDTGFNNQPGHDLGWSSAEHDFAGLMITENFFS